MPDDLSLLDDANTVKEGTKATLTILKDKALVCTKCDLHKTRTSVVFGKGNYDRPEILFVGEAPGHHEDQTGEPFVGRAGHLLDEMIAAMGYERSNIYICNVVNCRPPDNRKPSVEEMEACSTYLTGQIVSIKPKVIIALGESAAQTVCNSKKSISDLRNKWLEWKGPEKTRIPVRATFHPAYLLRRPDLKAGAWKDLQSVLKWLGQFTEEPPRIIGLD